MDYLDWNRLLGEHFFPSVKTDGASNYLCVTGQLLAELGGFSDSDSAIRDFIDAIIKGPKWTQIERCSNFLSKAHNCLYPDPKWDKRKVFFGKKTEKVNLTGHIHWKHFKDYAEHHPPYLAYLCLLILAFTERHDNDFALNYYEPLNRLLGTSDSILLGKRYTFNGIENTINTIWEDLKEWVNEKGIADFKFPPAKEEDYIYVPLYFGILKARDLRTLDEIFSLLESKNLINPDNVPSALQFVDILSKLPELPKHFSREGMQAVCENDLTKKRALGSLLYARYLVWDGNPEKDKSDSPLVFFRGVMLLRYLSSGSLALVVKIRSKSLLEKIPIEADREYQVKSDKCYSTVWPGGSSLWFQPLKIVPPDPFAEFLVEFEEIFIRPKMLAVKYIIMENYDLPYHLQGQNGFIEVETRKGLVPGRRYLLLSKTEEKPDLNEVEIIPNHGMVLPEKITAWWLNVPFNPDREKWPSALPPLADILSQARPSIRFESLVRTEPRSTRFLTGYPLRIISTHSDYEPFIKTNVKNPKNKLDPSDAGWNLNILEPSRLKISLRHKQDQTEAEGSDAEVEFLDPESFIQDQETSLLEKEENEKNISAIPPYPVASITLSGGKQVGIDDHGYPIFFCDDKPSVFLKSSSSMSRLFIDGNETENGSKPWSTEGIHTAQAKYKYNEILDSITFKLIKNSPEQKIKIQNISNNKEKPTKFKEVHHILLKTEYLTPLQVNYVIRDKNYKRSYRIKLIKEAQVILSEKTPLRKWHIYEIEFFHCSKSIFTGWFQWAPLFAKMPQQQKTYQRKGLLKLASIFDSIRKNKSFL